MVDRYIKLGPLEDVIIYNDAEFPTAIETDGDIEAANFTSGSTSGASGTFTTLTQIQAGGAGALGIQYKNRTITVTSGLTTDLGTESGWVDI